MRSSKYTVLFFGVLLIACKVFYWLYITPNADEAYYWLWGRKPALSYHDHPALHALIQGLFYSLFGKSLFVFRLPVFICLIIDLWIYYKIIKKLNNTTQPILIIIFIFTTPLIFLFTTYAWNDYMMITMCLCSGYFWLEYLSEKWDNRQGKTIDILLGFLFLGLAALSKYNAVFMALGIAYLVISKKQLHIIFNDIRLYIGIIICLLIISPIFIWNSTNNYGSFQFTLGQRTLVPLIETKFSNGNLLAFIVGTIILIGPIAVFFIIKILQNKNQYSSQIYTYNIVYQEFAKYIFLCSTISFFILSTFSNVLYYWNVQAYLFILPLTVIYLYQHNKKWVLVALIYSVLINTGLVIHFGIIPINKLLKVGQDKEVVYYFGWDQIGDRIRKIANKNPEKVHIFTSYYRSAALLSFQLDQTDIYSYSPRFDQFDYWTKNLKYDSPKAIILTDDRDFMTAELRVILDSIVTIDTIRVKKWGYLIKSYYIHSARIKSEYVDKKRAINKKIIDYSPNKSTRSL